MFENAVVIRHINCLGKGAIADLGSDFRRTLAVDVGHHDARALGGKLFSNAGAEPRRSTSDDGGLVLKTHDCFSYP